MICIFPQEDRFAERMGLIGLGGGVHADSADGSRFFGEGERM